ncbi:MAG: hypothetical protein IPQ02_11560 [Saprospiraceae bacterium]|nr:hypothetical protein [Candidatus Defluviibacterium haderslevense]
MLDSVISHVAINAPAYYSNWVGILGTFVKPYYDRHIGEQSADLKRNSGYETIVQVSCVEIGMNRRNFGVTQRKETGKVKLFIYVCEIKFVGARKKKVPEVCN